MSEIPLHLLGKSDSPRRTTYTALPGDDQADGRATTTSNGYGHALRNNLKSKKMPSSTRAAVAVAGLRRNRGEERYADDPEEQAGLLADEGEEGEGAYREDTDQETRAGEDSSVSEHMCNSMPC
jgi:hypothetical protein